MSIRSIDPDVPAELEMIVGKAMEKDPTARYQTAEDMRSDLLAYLRGDFVAEVPAAPLATVSPEAATELMTAPGATPGTLAAPSGRIPGGGSAHQPDLRSFSIVGLLAALAVGILLLSNLLSNTEEPPTIQLAVPSLKGLEQDIAFDTLQESPISRYVSALRCLKPCLPDS